LKYKEEEQKIFLSFMLTEPSLYTRVQNIYNPNNFTESLKPVAKYIQEYTNTYSTIPTVAQVNAANSTDLIPMEGLDKSHYPWFFDSFEEFTRSRELNRAILECVDLLDNDDYGPIEGKIKNAVQVSLTRDMGLDYYRDPKERLDELKKSNGQTSTGWKTMDEIMFGGFSRGELHIFSAQSGGGKSLSLQNLALNWTMAGLNGIYVTLELKPELVAMRLDSMLTGIRSKEIYSKLDEVDFKVRQAGKKNGKLKIKFLPAGSKINALKAYVKELRIKEGIELDYIAVDYIDLMLPDGVKIDPANLFIKDKYVSEELRNFAIEENVILASAAQLNRSGVDETEFSQANISGGITKVYTADGLYGIYQTRAMKERGELQYQFLKTRNSSGVGMKLDMAYNADSLRITDKDPNAPPVNGVTGSNPWAKEQGSDMQVIQPSISASNKQDKLQGLLATLNKR